MKRLILSTLSLLAIYICTTGYSSGPGLSGLNRTGSQGSTVGCGQGCHTASTNTMVTITVDSAGTAVTEWVPGVTYTIMLHGTNSASLAMFGFQFSAVKGVGNGQTQAGTFSGLPTNVHSATVTGLNIIEHGDQLPPTTPGVYDVAFQWTAPAAGAGTISMYAVLNAVNNNNSDNGDQYNNSMITLTEAVVACPLPVVSTQPVADTVCVESPATFTVATSSTGVSYQWFKGGVAISGATAATYTIPSATVASAGYYKVRLTNTCGITMSDSVLLTVNPLPVPTITQAGLTLSTGTFASYQWLKNGVAIAGATNQTYNVTTIGTYRVKVTNTNTCSDTSAGVTITSVGIAELGKDNQVTIYPNPAQSVINIKSPVVVNATIKTINGQTVLSRKNATSMDISSLAPGIYFIFLTDKNGVLVHKEKISRQ